MNHETNTETKYFSQNNLHVLVRLSKKKCSTVHKLKPFFVLIFESLGKVKCLIQELKSIGTERGKFSKNFKLQT